MNFTIARKGGMKRKKMPDVVELCEMKATSSNVERAWQRGLTSYPKVWETLDKQQPWKQK